MKTKKQRILVNNKERKFSAILHAVQLLMISDELVPEVMAFLRNLHASVGAISKKTVKVSLVLSSTMPWKNDK